MPLEQGISKLFHPYEVIIQAMIDRIVCKQTAQNTWKTKINRIPTFASFLYELAVLKNIMKGRHLVKTVFYFINLKIKFKDEFKQQYSRSFQGRLL